MIDIIKSIFNIISYACLVVILFTSYIVSAYVYYLIPGKRKGKNLEKYVGKFFIKPTIIVLTIIVFAIALSKIIWLNFDIGTTQIGGLFEKREYIEQYYVYMATDINDSKHYKLKADIYKGDIFSEIGFDSYFEGNGYLIYRLYFPNGGYLSFLWQEADYDVQIINRVYTNEETEVIDSHGDTYYITLTTEKTSE